MKGRTYRYFEGDPLYPFGFGLSYTEFLYGKLALDRQTVKAGEPLTASFEVTNAGKRDGDEVVQLYLSWPSAPGSAPLRQLAGFQRIHLKAGASTRVSFVVTDRQMSLVGDDGSRVLGPGRLRLTIGGRQPDPRSEKLAGTPVLNADFTVTGRLELPA
jgi:beta-glucosidase